MNPVPKSNNSKKYLVSAEGHEKLSREIERLKQEVKEIGIKKGEAAGSGSAQWHDNPAYEELEHEERRLSRKLDDLREKFAKAEIVSAIKSGIIGIGNIVKLKYLDSEELDEYLITDSETSDPNAGKISYQSPLGAVLIGKKIGDVVDFRGRKIEIINIG